MRTTKECLERLESKIDEIRQDLQAIHELIAKNEAEHNFYEKRLIELENKKSQSSQVFAWLSGVLGVMLAIISILKFFWGQ